MEELLRQINETFDNCIEAADDNTKLQLKIVKGNINTLFEGYIGEKPTEQILEEAIVNTAEIRGISSTGKKILIVDDSSIVRNYLQKILSNDYSIELATDGQDAINQLAEVNGPEDLSLILLDLMMPNIDGFGVLEYLTGRNLKIPVVVISGDNSQETIVKAFNYKVADMIEKPFDAKTIMTKIQRIM